MIDRAVFYGYDGVIVSFEKNVLNNVVGSVKGLWRVRYYQMYGIEGRIRSVRS